jgi:hypothetical protein
MFLVDLAHLLLLLLLFIFLISGPVLHSVQQFYKANIQEVVLLNNKYIKILKSVFLHAICILITSKVLFFILTMYSLQSCMVAVFCQTKGYFV